MGWLQSAEVNIVLAHSHALQIFIFRLDWLEQVDEARLEDLELLSAADDNDDDDGTGSGPSTPKKAKL